MKRYLIIAAGLCISLAPSSARAQRWTATESLRLTSPAPNDSTFGDVRGLVIGTTGDFYVLERKRSALYGFTPAGQLKWKADVPFRPNPIFAMMGDTAAMRELASTMDNMPDSMFPRRARAGAGRANGAAGGRAGGRANGAAGGRAGGRANGAAGGRAAGRAGSGGRGAGGMGSMSDLLSSSRMDSMSIAVGGALVSLAGGELAVADLMGRETTVYDTTGTQLRSEGFFPMTDAPMQWSSLGSNIVASTRSLTDVMGSMMSGKTDGGAVSVKVMPTSRTSGAELTRVAMPLPMSMDPATMTMRISTQPGVLLMASTGSRLFVASNQHYSITMFDSTGAKIGTLERNVARKPLTAADKIRATRQFAQMMDSIPPMIRQQLKMQPNLSDSLPAIAQLAAGDSIVLVRRGAIESRDATVQAANTSRWDVLGWDNKYRGYVDLPSGYTVPAISGGKLYGVMSTRGTSAVVVMRLSPPVGAGR
jgi:hypothetical protein